jgi:hypothetical protein
MSRQGVSVKILEADTRRFFWTLVGFSAQMGILIGNPLAHGLLIGSTPTTLLTNMGFYWPAQREICERSCRMRATSNERKPLADLLRQVLVDFLFASRAVAWPGADGLTVDDIINCYPQAIAAGEVPAWHELQCRFPDLAGELQALRLAKGWLESPVPR